MLTPEQAAHYYKVCLHGCPWVTPVTKGRSWPRQAAWFTHSPCRCAYRYSNQSFPPHEFPPWLEEIWQLLRPHVPPVESGVCPNAANFNLYRLGSHSVGWHADDEALFDAVDLEATIISLSLGASRTFELKQRKAADDEAMRLDLRTGDLAAMHGLVQRHYLHRIPKQRGKDAANEGRINITFRWIRKHSADDSCPLLEPAS